MAKTTKQIKQSLKGMSGDELRKNLVLTEENLRSLRFKAEGAKSKNVKEGVAFRKQIARILTEINSKERVGQK